MLSEEICYQDFLNDVVLDNNKGICPSENLSFPLETIPLHWIFSAIDPQDMNIQEECIADLYSYTNYTNSSVSENFEVGFPKSDQGDAYSLEDAVKAHMENVELRGYIQDKLWYEYIPAALGVGYYAFVIYTCPVAGLSLGAFKALKASGAFDDVCNESYSVLGLTMCDFVEEALFSQTLLSVGGKLALTFQGAEPTTAQKVVMGSLDKLFRKTMLSNSRMTSGRIDDFLVEGEAYAPNIAFVVASEAVEMVTNHLIPIDENSKNVVMKAFRAIPHKIAGQLSKQVTKDLMSDRKTEYGKPTSKVVVITACSIVLPEFKKKLWQAHVYGHCLSMGGFISSRLVQEEKEKIKKN